MATTTSYRHARAPSAATNIDPYMTMEHSQRSEVFDLSGGRKTGVHGIEENQHTTLLTYGLRRI